MVDMKTCLSVGFAVLLLMTAQGCIAVPVPNWRVAADGVESQVVDADTHAPVPHALIYPDHSDSPVEADADGRFRIRPVIEWHAAYLWSPIKNGYPILPFTGEEIYTWQRRFKVVADGYSTDFFIALPDPSLLHREDGWEYSTLATATIHDDMLCVPKVEIHPHARAYRQE